MSLVANVTALAARIATEFKSIRAALDAKARTGANGRTDLGLYSIAKDGPTAGIPEGSIIFESLS